MLANGLVEVAPSIYRGRPRGIVAAGVEEPNALLQIDGPCSEGMLPGHDRRAVRRPVRHHAVRDGPARPDSGPRRLRQEVRPHRRAGRRRRTGRARGRRRCRRLRRPRDPRRRPARARRFAALRRTDVGAQSAHWAAEVRAALDAAPEVVVLHRTTAFGSYDDNYVLALQRRTDHLGADAPSLRRRLAPAAVAHPGPPGGPGDRRARASAGLRRQRPARRDARRGRAHRTSTGTPWPRARGPW